jgi:hypothetical protein
MPPSEVIVVVQSRVAPHHRGLPRRVTGTHKAEPYFWEVYFCELLSLSEGDPWSPSLIMFSIAPGSGRG